MELNQPSKILCLIDVDQPEENASQNPMIVEVVDEEDGKCGTNTFKLFTSSFEKVLEIIEEYEISTVTKFLQVLDKSYDTTKSLLHWDTVTGNPYVIVGYSRWYCQHSRSRDIAKKPDAENKPEKRKYKRTVESKKGNCQASIAVSHLVQFPQYQYAASLSRRKRVEVNKQILFDFRHQSSEITQEHLYQISFPADDSHTGHVVGQDAGSFQPTDRRIILKISGLIQEGVSSFPAIKRELDSFVCNELFRDKPPPSKSNRRFFPTDDNLRSHRKRALARIQESGVNSTDYIHKQENENEVGNFVRAT